MATGKEFDEGADAASGQLAEMLGDGRVQVDTLVEIASWWERWLMVAGHKRLGRAVRELGKREGVSSNAPDDAG